MTHTVARWIVCAVVLDDPSMPIVGEGDEEPNDSFISQLVASARAAVDEVARRGHALGDVRVVGSLRQTGPTATRTRIGHGDPVATEQPRQ